MKRGAKRRKATAKRPAARRPRKTTVGVNDLEKRLADVLAQQAATAEILRLIRSSPTDVRPVFDAIAQSAARLCESVDAVIMRRDGDRLILVAHHGAIPTGRIGEFTLSLSRGSYTGRAVLEARTIHVADAQAAAKEFPEGSAVARQLGFRTLLTVPLMRGGAALGAVGLRRTEARLFTDRQVALLQTFADQAVIAIENVRLFAELQEKNTALTRAHAQVTEALEQQTATADILKVISSSPTDVEPVFDTIVHSAARLCESEVSFLFRFDGERLHFAAHHGLTPRGYDAVLEAWRVPPPATRGTGVGRSVLDRTVAHIPDVHADPQYVLPAVAELAGFASVLAVPMLRDGTPIGAISVNRVRSGPFSERHIELLKTFADQAVIAIQNVHLFQELESRNGELRTSLEQQTATSELLKVIGRSTFDLQPVFETLAENAVRLCEAERAFIFRYDGQVLRGVAGHNVSPELRAFVEQNPVSLGRNSATARAGLERRVVHVQDAASDPEYTYGGLQVDRYRTIVGIPMLRAGELLGVITIYRHEVRPFTDGQIALMETFADQAAIAIENARLLTELQAKNTSLTETLEQQTAAGEILRVISSSPTDVQPVFDAVATSAARLCDAYDAAIHRMDGDVLRLVAHDGPIAPDTVLPVAQGTLAGHVIRERRAINVADLQAETEAYPMSAEFARNRGFRTILSVPLLRAAEAIGVITIRRTEVRPFTDRQAELLKTFADQAVIAVENVRLFTELGSRNAELHATLEQQTATGEILRVISGSPTDEQPVFDAIVQSARQLCEATFSVVMLARDGQLAIAAVEGLDPAGTVAIHAAYPMPSTGPAPRAARCWTVASCTLPIPGSIPSTRIPCATRSACAPSFQCRSSGRARRSGRSASGAPSPARSPTSRSRCSRPSPTRRSSRSRTSVCSRSWRLGTARSPRRSTSRRRPARSCGSSRAHPPMSSRCSTPSRRAPAGCAMACTVPCSPMMDR